MSDIVIRLARAEDLDETVRMWERSRWKVQAWLEERMRYTHDDNLRHFRDVVMQENRVWLAVEGGKIVGLLAMSPPPESEPDVQYAWRPQAGEVL